MKAAGTTVRGAAVTAVPRWATITIPAATWNAALSAEDKRLAALASRARRCSCRVRAKEDEPINEEKPRASVGPRRGAAGPLEVHYIEERQAVARLGGRPRSKKRFFCAQNQKENRRIVEK
jgi:hypothetical protein